MQGTPLARHKATAPRPAFTVRRITYTIGAEVQGLDLSQPLSVADADALYAALAEHKVLFFRGQQMTPTQHLALARTFGTPTGKHPVYPCDPETPEVTVLVSNAANPPDTDSWHTDLTWSPEPIFASILYCRETPDVGGDTLWADMAAAYDALPAGVKADIAELRCVHDMADFRNNFTVGEPDGAARKLNDAFGRFGSAIHPMVCVHPFTKRKYLNCNPGFVNQVVGMKVADSRRLLTYLWDHLNSPEFHVRFAWTVDAVAMWDNLQTMHYGPCAFDLTQTRRMSRVTVANDRRADELRAAEAEAPSGDGQANGVKKRKQDAVAP